jgi:hypothetical protein
MTKQTRLTSPETNPTTISITELRAALSGRVIAPDDAGYDEARHLLWRDRPPASGNHPGRVRGRRLASRFSCA